MHVKVKGAIAEKVLEDNKESMYYEWTPFNEGTNGGTRCMITISHIGRPCTSVKDIQELMYKYSHNSSDEDEEDED